MANHFLPQVKKQGVKLPVLLLTDGHKSYVRLENAEFATGMALICIAF